MAESVTSQLTARRTFGLALKSLRQEMDMTAEEVAEELGLHNSTISRFESGSRRCQPGDFDKLMALFRVRGDELTRLRGLWEQGRRRRTPWYAKFNDVISAGYASYIDYETDATKVFECQTVVIPALAQTTAYAEEMSTDGFSSLGEFEAETHAEIRVLRQRRLHGPDALDCSWVVTQAALEFQVAGPEGHLEQLQHLRKLCDMENIDFRVIPFTQRAPSIAGCFTVFQLAGQDSQDVAFVQSVTGSLREDDPRNLRRLHKLFGRLQASALSSAATRDLLDQMIEERH